MRTATVIGAIAATTIGVIGYHFIHKFNKIGTWFMGGSLLIGLMIMVPHINADVLAKGSFNMKGWFAMFGLCAVWQISFHLIPQTIHDIYRSRLVFISHLSLPI